MKRNLYLLITAFAICTFFSSCSPKKTGGMEAQSDTTRWASMDAYHKVMAEVYHPFRDNKDLGPLKKLVESLVTEADAWAAASLPAKVNTGEVKEIVGKLKTETHQLADQVKSGVSDEQLGAGLTALHERFHSLMETWNGEKEKSEHSEKHEEH